MGLMSRIGTGLASLAVATSLYGQAVKNESKDLAQHQAELTRQAYPDLMVSRRDFDFQADYLGIPKEVRKDLGDEVFKKYADWISSQEKKRKDSIERYSVLSKEKEELTMYPPVEMSRMDVMKKIAELSTELIALSPIVNGGNFALALESPNRYFAFLGESVSSRVPYVLEKDGLAIEKLKGEFYQGRWFDGNIRVDAPRGADLEALLSIVDVDGVARANPEVGRTIDSYNSSLTPLAKQGCSVLIGVAQGAPIDKQGFIDYFSGPFVASDRIVSLNRQTLPVLEQILLGVSPEMAQKFEDLYDTTTYPGIDQVNKTVSVYEAAVKDFPDLNRIRDGLKAMADETKRTIRAAYGHSFGVSEVKRDGADIFEINGQIATSDNPSDLIEQSKLFVPNNVYSVRVDQAVKEFRELVRQQASGVLTPEQVDKVFPKGN